MRWMLLWIMPLVQDQSLGLLTSSPACYHCTTDATYLVTVLWYWKSISASTISLYRGYNNQRLLCTHPILRSPYPIAQEPKWYTRDACGNRWSTGGTSWDHYTVQTSIQKITCGEYRGDGVVSWHCHLDNDRLMWIMAAEVSTTYTL